MTLNESKKLNRTAALLLAGMIYMLVRPYKEATKLTKTVKVD